MKPFQFLIDENKYNKIKEYVNKILTDAGKTDVVVRHIRELNENEYIGDVTYKWIANGYVNEITQKDVLFLFKNGEIISSLGIIKTD